jgi:predicted N-formylglutamate amidohydrolase
MSSQIENINVEVPHQFLSPLWRKYGKDRKCEINISYSFDGKKADVFLITAIATRDRHITRSNEFYDYLDTQALAHATQKHGIYKTSPMASMVSEYIIDNTGELKTCVELAEAYANPGRLSDNSVII